MEFTSLLRLCVVSFSQQAFWKSDFFHLATKERSQRTGGALFEPEILQIRRSAEAVGWAQPKPHFLPVSQIQHFL